MNKFTFAHGIVSMPPSLTPTFFKMDLAHAVSPTMMPFIFVFLFMLVFDAIGTLIGVAEQASFMKDDGLARARQAMISDAVGTVAGAGLGTSTVTGFIESAAGVAQGGRTGPDRAGSGRVISAGAVFQSDREHDWKLSSDRRAGAGGGRRDDGAERDEDRLERF